MLMLHCPFAIVDFFLSMKPEQHCQHTPGMLRELQRVSSVSMHRHMSHAFQTIAIKQQFVTESDEITCNDVCVYTVVVLKFLGFGTSKQKRIEITQELM